MFNKVRQNWQFFGICYEGNTFSIGQTEIWKHEWQKVVGEKAIVKDPRYGQTFEFQVYEIKSESGDVEFAAGEFSNGVWGFYRRKKN